MVEIAKVSIKKPEAKRENKASQTPEICPSQSISSPAEQILLLQRTIGNQAVQRLIRSRALQAKLRIGQPGDKYEHEADRVAQQVMRMPEPVVQPKRSCPFSKGSSCKEKEEILQKKDLGGEATQSSPTVESQINNLRGGGQPLPESVSAVFEPRFGQDFSQVRVHFDAAAAQSAQDVNAHAYTMGHDIVFGDNRFAPGTHDGRRLIAHELTHVMQQSGSGDMQLEKSENNVGISSISSIKQQGFGTLQRCYNPAKNDPLYDGFAKVIKATPAYNALADKILADSIITDMKKKPDCLYLAEKLKKLFDTPEKAPATISTETKSSTVQETAIEQTRIAKPAEAKNLTVEETASADPARTWVKIKGKFGGGTYQVDRTNPKNIVVKAKVFLKTAGTGTAVDISNIKKMEDGIEKAASVKGFTVDIEFVNVPDAETFTAVVDPGKWEDAENWSGGNPTGFAHELLHMFAFEVDRYNYIESHSTNPSMTVPNRLIWFAKQLTKPAGFDNPLSIMGSGEHPLDDDVCRVAGLDIASCVAARKKPAKP